MYCISWIVLTFLAIMNIASLNIMYNILCRYVFISLNYMSRNWIFETSDNCFTFREITQLSSKEVALFYVPNSSIWEFNFSHIFSNICYLLFWSQLFYWAWLLVTFFKISKLKKIITIFNMREMLLERGVLFFSILSQELFNRLFSLWIQNV